MMHRTDKLSNLSQYCNLFSLHYLRIFTGKKHRQIKLQRLQKVQMWSFELIVHTKFLKNKVVTGKTSFFVIGPFCTHHSIVFTLASNMVVLYGKDGFSLSVLSNKKQCSSF